MRTSMILLVLIALPLTTFAQNINESEVPAAVITSLQNDYPGVTVSSWELDEGNYEAEFTHNGSETEATYDGNGIFVESEVNVTPNHLPQNMLMYIGQNLQGIKLDYTVVTNASNVVSYEAEGETTDYLFDSDGNFVGTEEDTE